MKKNSLTAFQIKVLKATSKIPLGEVKTYKWIAKRIGRPRAYRAVGSALRKNPYPLIIPCHRVINSDGTLGGYRGGRKFKKNLLLLEKCITKLIQ